MTTFDKVHIEEGVFLESVTPHPKGRAPASQNFFLTNADETRDLFAVASSLYSFIVLCIYIMCPLKISTRLSPVT